MKLFRLSGKPPDRWSETHCVIHAKPVYVNASPIYLGRLYPYDFVREIAVPVIIWCVGKDGMATMQVRPELNARVKGRMVRKNQKGYY